MLRCSDVLTASDDKRRHPHPDSAYFSESTLSSFSQTTTFQALQEDRHSPIDGVAPLVHEALHASRRSM